MLSFKQYLIEILNKKQKKWIDNRAVYSSKTHNNLFDNPPEHATKIDNDTITLPLGEIDKSRENEIRNHLKNHGIEIDDYINGKAKDKYGREVSIPKALGKTKKDPNLYATDPRIKAKNSNNISPDTHEIVLSRNKYHVGGMSSGRHWDSCMTLPNDNRNKFGGSLHKKIYDDLNNDTLIAYLTQKGKIKPNKELDADDAMSRILLKKYESPEGHVIFRPEKNSYSPSIHSGSTREKYPEFSHSINKFSNEYWKHNPEHLYIKDHNLYNDDGNTFLPSDYKDFTAKHLHQYAKHINHLRDIYDDEYTKNPENLHQHRIRIADHPNTSDKTLQELLTSTLDDYRYTHGIRPYYDLLDSIHQHPNASNETLKHVRNEHEDSDVRHDINNRLLADKNLSGDDIHDIAQGFNDDDEFSDKIIKHPNVSSDTLHHLFIESDKPHIHVDIAKHPNTNNDTHERILKLLNNDYYDKEDSKDILNGISKNSKNPNMLHKLALDNHETHKTLSKNKHIHSPTLQHIYYNLDHNNPENNNILKNISIHPNASQALLSEISDNKHKIASKIAQLRLEKNKYNRIL